MARGNTCAQPDPIVTADFAYCAICYGAACGIQEYCDRGAAALRAALNWDCAPSERARVKAIASIIEREFGAVYVSVSGKWCVELNGCRIDALDIKGTSICLSTAGTAGGRVVFAGLRAKTYEVCINGRRNSYSRETMEAGLPVSV